MVDHAEDQAVQEVYARMRRNGETFAQAVASVGLSNTETPLVRRRLSELGLLHGTAEIAVDAVAALTRILGDGRERLTEALATLTEQQDNTLALANDYLRPAGDERAGADVEILRDDDTFRPRIEALLDEFASAGRHELIETHPYTAWDPRHLDAGLRRDRELHERGAQIRLLYSQRGLRHGPLRDNLPKRLELGVQVKATPIVPIRMVVYDREVAVVDAPNDPDIRAIVLRNRLLVGPLVDFFDYCWLTATEIDDVLRGSDDSGLSEQQRAVLRLLATGAKDEAIARSLGVSVRTVTRVVAELTGQLGAPSRFQAGVQAARLGWLD
ncbi:helix-turn-helix transcriptional regulator [Glycomyces tenuis]|uniref:helix-turn-helix transcriptional regulator n=1 Tax=Glycomyces tenuis TaxID=58116 RepID=UPI000691601E|nr:LuxR C-terminal-related transcriptional regulator [Glycomyces tenuis]